MRPLLFTMSLAVCCLSKANAQDMMFQKSSMASAAGSVRVNYYNGKEYFISHSIGQRSPFTGLQNERLYVLQGFEYIFLNTYKAGKGSDLYVFPNPTNGLITVIGMTALKDEEITFSLHSIDGKTIKENKVIARQKATLDYTHIAKGMYILELSGKLGVHLTTKIILQ